MNFLMNAKDPGIDIGVLLKSPRVKALTCLGLEEKVEGFRRQSMYFLNGG